MTFLNTITSKLHPLNVIKIAGMITAIIIGLSLNIDASEIESKLQTLTPKQKGQILNELESKGGSEGQATEGEPTPVRVLPTIPVQTSKIEETFNKPSEASTGFSAKLHEADDSALRGAKASLLTGNKQFGYDIFTKAPYTKSSVVLAPVGLDYIVGPGDTLKIKSWGKLEQSLDVDIDASGQIYIPQLGTISVAGDTLKDASRKIKNEYSRLYVNFDMDVSVSKLRNIKVFVLGEVVAPGSYEISSLSTVMMALYLSGGPTKMGSLRKIRLIRNQKTVQTIDLYDYLLYGNKNQDPQLKSFDTIYVPIIGDVINVTGMVKRPAIFEAKETMNAYQAIYNFAGGPALGYYAKHIQIERIKEGEKRVLDDLKFKDASEMERKLKTISLVSGDSIRVLSIFDTIYQKIDINGSVVRPGQYQYTEKLTLGEALKKAGGVLDDAYTKRINIYRRLTGSNRQIIALDLSNTDNLQFKLEEFDVVEIKSTNEVDGSGYVSISGAVKSAGEYQLLAGMTINDLLFIAGVSRTAYLSEVELVRENQLGDKEIQLILKADFDSTLLQEKDRLYIREESEKFRLKTVDLTGQIKYPGRYVIKDKETLSDIITRAGGYTERAYPEGIIFTRDPANEDVAGQKVLVEEQKRLIYEKELRAGDTTEKYQKAYQDALLFLSKEINANTNRVIISQKDGKIREDHDLLLQDGDRILIPEEPQTVQVVGGVNQPTSLIYQKNKNIHFYISQAGGYSKYANKKEMLVVKANGTVLKYNQATIEKGDYIYVPEEVTFRKDYLTLLVEVTKILANIATTILLINSI